MNLAVRSRRAGDIAGLAHVLKRVYEADGYPVEGVSAPENWLRPARELRSWVAVVDELLIGQISLTRAQEDDDAAVAWKAYTGGDVQNLAIPSRLFVDPSYRTLGAGRVLMEAAVNFAQENQWAIAFDVMLKDRSAIRLYERLGARRISEIIHSYGGGLTEPAAVFVI